MATAAEFNPIHAMRDAGLTSEQIHAIGIPYLIGYLSAFVTEEAVCKATEAAVRHALKEQR